MNFKATFLVLLLVGVAFAAEVSDVSLDATERSGFDHGHKVCFKKIVKCCYKYKKCGFYCKRHGKYYKKVCYKKFCPKLICEPEVIYGDSTVPKPFEKKVY